MHKFSWVKDVVIQIVFISAAITFTVIIAHMSIQELYTYYYIHQTEIATEMLTRNTALLHETISEFAIGVVEIYDQTLFMDFSQELSENLYSSLFRGILLMAVGYVLFAIIMNLQKKDDDNNFDNDNDDEPNAITSQERRTSPPRLLIQLFSMVMCGAFAGIFFWLQISFYGLLQIVFILLGGMFLGLALAHLVRMLLWIIGKRTGAKSSYSAQTTQFCIFLMVFLSLFSLSMHNGFSSHIEGSNLRELQVNSLFISLAISHGHEDLAREFDLGEHSESFIYFGAPDVVGRDSSAYDLFTVAWDEHASVMGIRGDYKYGVTVIFDIASQSVVGFSVVRKPTAILANELRSATTDFMLAVSATVFAFVFLFIELNKLLESINVPNLKRESDWKYAAGAKSLNFLLIICKTIPAYFFVLIVLNIYEHNPVEWLPSEVALILPLGIVMLMMMVGGEVAASVIKLLPRRLSVFGCIIAAAGFFTISFADNLFTSLLLLAIAFLGAAIAYMGVQQFISDAVDTGYREFRTLGEETLSGEYLGGASGAVLGAVVFDQFGLFAAFALSAVIMILLAVLIKFMFPIGERKEPAKSEFGLFRFLFSKRILIFAGFLMAPFMVGEFFISQFVPLYADTINLSPGAASWTYLLMTMAAAFAAPFVARALLERLRKITVCVFANFLSASGLVMFSLMPGIFTMYIASALLGFSIGAGTNMVESGYADLEESQKYTRSHFAFRMFGVVFGQLGVALFTIAHTLSPGGEYVFIIAGIIAIPTLLYFVLSPARERVSS